MHCSAFLVGGLKRAPQIFFLNFFVWVVLFGHNYGPVNQKKTHQNLSCKVGKSTSICAIDLALQHMTFHYTSFHNARDTSIWGSDLLLPKTCQSKKLESWSLVTPTVENGHKERRCRVKIGKVSSSVTDNYQFKFGCFELSLVIFFFSKLGTRVLPRFIQWLKF